MNYPRRREFIALSGVAVATAAFSTGSAAASEPPLLVYFASATKDAASRWIGFLQDGLKEQGYTEGENYKLVGRFAEFEVARLPSLAEEAVRLAPSIIVAGAVDTAVAARRATSTIPIISGALADAIDLGLAASYAHPGGNVTGITPYVDGLPAKQMEFAREIVPDAAKIGLVGNVNDPKAIPQRDELIAAAQKLGVTVIAPKVDTPSDLSAAVQGLKNAGVAIVIVLQTTMLLGQRKQLAQLFAEAELPAVYGYREHVDEGGLASYGVDLSWCWRHVASYVRKILHGAKPAELPIEFPPRLQMVINVKRAKELGLSVPPTLLARADEVIE
jgi:putative ABC transport system substrate-binding protein